MFQGVTLDADEVSPGQTVLIVDGRIAAIGPENSVTVPAETGTYLAGHVPEEVGVARALEAGQATIDHIDGYPQYMVSPEFDPSSTDAGFYGVNLVEMIDDEQIAQAARKTRDAGVWIVPTNTMIANVALASPSAEKLAARRL